MSASSADRRCHRWQAVNLAPNCPSNVSTSSSTSSSSTSTVQRFSSQCFGLPMCSLIVVLIANLISPSESISCELAHTKCAYRSGCGLALQSYMVHCSSLIGGQTDRCHQQCENALISLISSEEGADLVTCDCEGSKYCEKSKERIQVCRPTVDLAVAENTIVSCTTARWICMADVLCHTALEYYHLYCRGLFHGSKCTSRCKNSLSILERQEKAAKLRTCYCDGTEKFPCKRVKYNTERYCYNRIPPLSDKEGWDPDDPPNNSIEVIGSSASYHHGHRHKHKHRSDVNATSAAVPMHQSAAPLLCLVLLLPLLAAITANRFRSNIAALIKGCRSQKTIDQKVTVYNDAPRAKEVI